MSHHASMLLITTDVDIENAGGNLTDTTIHHAITDSVPPVTTPVTSAMTDQISAFGAPASPTANTQGANPPPNYYYYYYYSYYYYDYYYYYY